ncbi:SMP-30/gluconolactonase/LRE family protein [Subtercola endophyticus]|uniref:SMP-30/gluconolactonase/LRE family protein n=1 Tax=Subtercola endophyticus TaxID=2895559 RepID=UPI001E2B99BB|nr:SMP-30/gluconolactonase/LRE family protein [Subtercola endophyticus]UFS58559.1 SMP-30/gluconolactonase/LRE family protein [Subtercola endophyticus]
MTSSARELRTDARTWFVTAADLVGPAVQALVARVASPVGARSSALGESPFWDHRDETLYWVDIVGGRLCAWSGAGDPIERLTGCAGMSLVRGASDQSGTALLIAAPTGVSVIGGKGIIEYGRPASMAAQLRFNDGECDAFGRLWIGTLDDEAAEPGRLYSLDPDGGWLEHLRDLDCPNGIGWNPDGVVMYLVESVSRRILTADFDVQTGSPSRWRVAVQFDPAGPLPDGLTMTVDGALWVAFWGGSCLVLLDAEAGRVLSRVEVPTPLVTSTVAARGGIEMFVTTARAPDARPDDLAAGRLYRFSSPVAGAAQHRFGSRSA